MWAGRRCLFRCSVLVAVAPVFWARVVTGNVILTLSQGRTQDPAGALEICMSLELVEAFLGIQIKCRSSGPNDY